MVEGCANILIFDMTGRMLQHYNETDNINVSDLNNGLYMMRVITDDGRCYTEKFIINK